MIILSIDTAEGKIALSRTDRKFIGDIKVEYTDTQRLIDKADVIKLSEGTIIIDEVTLNNILKGEKILCTKKYDRFRIDLLKEHKEVILSIRNNGGRAFECNNCDNCKHRLKYEEIRKILKEFKESSDLMSMYEVVVTNDGENVKYHSIKVY